jgi:hypothetical protein
VGIPFAADPGWSIEGIARVGEENREYAFRAIPTHAPSSVHPVPRASLSRALADHPFLERDPARSGWLRVKRGSWDVAGWLVLPEGFGLQIAAGTTLRFEKGAGLVATGPLDLRGRPGAPVVLEGRSSSAGSAEWGGLVVLSSEAASRWSHVVVRNTAGVRRGSWVLTGGVTFRRSEVEISDSLFEGSRAEDALNLVRSRFTLRESDFRNARSDALDADFCEGRVEGGVIRYVGGDGIDVAGTRIEVDGVHLGQVRDKALSVGEGSSLRARELRVESSGIGVASKDGSRSFVDDSRFEKIGRVALAAYVKKPLFGPAELVAEKVEIDARSRSALAQLGSRVSIDGTEVPPEPLDVAELYDSGSENP